ncbi:hypothetical protein RCL_jg5383.t1 [Rhizophagus clarus]|uniref:Uncharacterized protein n=1 Tax=Rhizophagus clarus TaxID=94130 RepID=A0A8H3LND2_9GLOM|nr:hypothetical protein RCL_jg5383.t1 [Rhizophagus clarus]
MSDSRHSQTSSIRFYATFANLSLLLEVLQGMYGKGLAGGAKASLDIRGLKFPDDPRGSDYATISISRCSHLIKLGY